MQRLLRSSHHSGHRLGRENYAPQIKGAAPFSISGKLRLVLLAWLVAACACNVMASEVEIRVVDQTTAKPLKDAAVCLGTGADSSQFGALMTSRDGTVSFSKIPNTPLLLTISKPGFIGYQRPQSAGEYNRVILVKLATGGLGPICHASKSAAKQSMPAKAGLRVKRFLVNGGKIRTRSRRVTLSSRVTGKPTHYRVSERSDFSTASWKPYEKQTVFQLSESSGRKTIYFQVRRYKEANGSNVQSTSNVVTARISLISG